MKTLIRIYHPYWEWEETKYNLWGNVDDKEKYLQEAMELMKNTEAWGKCMMEVVKQWTNSCEHNLSNTSSNRKSWLGQAACAFALYLPEDITRQAWQYLTEEEREKANKKAEESINYWETKIYAKKEIK